MRRAGSKHKLLISLTTVLTIAVALPAQAQLLGQVTTAKTLLPGTQDLGGFVGAFDHSTTVFGQYRRGISRSLDFGLQAGLMVGQYIAPRGLNYGGTGPASWSKARPL